MKNIKQIFLVIALLAAVACENQILDKQPLDTITDATVWEDANLINGFLTTQYTLSVVMVQESSSYIAGWGAGSPVDGGWDIYGSEHGGGMFAINNLSDEGKGGWDFTGHAGFKSGGINVNSAILPWWEYPYYIIRNLNMLIARVPTSPIEDADKVQMIAEARFLRAFNYFAMVKRYGGVPIITDVQSIDDSEEILYPERNSEQEVYDFILSELTDISGDLPTEPTYDRPSKWAVLALQSRAALYAGSIAQNGTVQLDGLLGISAGDASKYYQMAYDAADSIIQYGPHSLYDVNTDKTMNFRELFMQKRNVETIFIKAHDEVDALGAQGHTWNYDFGQRPKPHGWDLGMANTPYLEFVEAFENIDGTSGTLDRTALQSQLWTMEELWGNKDPRFAATVYTQETPWQLAVGIGGLRDNIVDFHNGLIDSTGVELSSGTYNSIPVQGTQNVSGMFHTGFGVMKYLDEDLSMGGTWSHSSSDYVVFRYGEVLLNYAEAAYELGNTGDALTQINAIRTRAGIENLTSIDQEQVRHERRIELAYEGHRYWDLRRWRTAATELTTSFSGLRYIYDYNTGKYMVEVLDDIDGSTAPPTFYSYNYYFPITLTRTGVNSNLVENPGY